jgi:hypothetical protein
MSKITVKQTLDDLFKDIKFDAKLYKKIVMNNIEFITRNNEYKNLFGSRLIGNHMVKYTMYDKDIFYNNLFDMSYTDVSDKIEEITSINKTFKIARDDVNLVCFYIVHRFLSNKELTKDKALEYSKEILNYFSYRTLVLITSNYFIYPISDEKALTLIEKLNNKYIIKKLKNWNEYCIYRSEEYFNGRYIDMITKLNKDDELPNAITDLYNRTKDTIKHIYVEFMDMIENDDIIKSKRSVVNDIEGQEVIVDKLDTPEKYFIKIENMIVDKSIFIKQEYLNVTIDIIKSVSYKQLEEALNNLIEFSHVDRKNNDRILNFVKDILVNTIVYLNKNSIFIHNKSDVLAIINNIVGNILHARGSDIDINKVKEDGDKLIKDIYKFNKKYINDRNIKNLRNALYIYVVLLAIIGH